MKRSFLDKPALSLASDGLDRDPDGPSWRPAACAPPPASGESSWLAAELERASWFIAPPHQGGGWGHFYVEELRSLHMFRKPRRSQRGIRNLQVAVSESSNGCLSGVLSERWESLFALSRMERDIPPWGRNLTDSATSGLKSLDH